MKNTNDHSLVILKSIGEGVITTNSNGAITFMNESAEQLTGWKQSESLNQPLEKIYNLTNEETGLRFENIVTRILREGKIIEFENNTLLETKDARKIIISNNGAPIRNNDEEIIGAVLVFRDITEKKKAEAKLLETLKEISDYKYAMDESSIIGITDQKGLIKHVNENFCKISQYSEQELIGQDHRIINSGFHSKEFMKNLWTTIANGKVWRGEVKNKAKDGTYYWVDATIVPFLNEAGKPFQYVAIRNDITERKKAEEELKQSDNLHRELIENIADAIILINEKLEIIYQSPSVTRITGLVIEDATNKTVIDFIHPDDIPTCLQFFQDVFASPGVPLQNSFRILHKQGHYIWIEGTITNLLNDESVKAFVVNYRDITERKKAEEELRKLSQAVEQSPATVIITDTEGNIEYVNKKFITITGYSKDEVIGKNPRILKTGYTPAIEYKNLWERITSGLEWRGELHNKKKNGELYWQSALISPIKDEEGMITNFLAVKEDITEKKKAEEVLKEYKHFFYNSNDLSCIANTDGYFELLNPNFSKHLGYTNDELTANPFLIYVHPDDIDATLLEVEKLKGGALTINFVNRYKKKDGSYLWLDWNTTPDPVTGKLYAIARDITERKKTEQELIIREKKLNEAQSLAKVGSWGWNLQTGEIIFSDEMFKIFGLNKETCAPRMELIFDLIHPDDKENVLNKLNNPQNLKSEEPNRYRIITPAGEIKTIETRRSTRQNNNGDIVFLSGTMQDITETAKLESDLLMREEKLKEAQSLAKVGSWELNLETGETLRSDELFKLLEIQKDDDTVGNALLLNFVHPDDKKRISGSLSNVRAGMPIEPERFRIITRNGTIKHVETRGRTEKNNKGEIIKLYGTVQDITETINLENEKNEIQERVMTRLEENVIERTRELELKNKGITDSINYAKRIQTGLLTRDTQLSELFSSSFILSQACDIISGDFFWCYERRNKKFIAVADCTGHGVPGALMSMIGNNLLNQIVVDEHIENPVEILEELDKRVWDAVKGDLEDVRDGMDIALVIVDSHFKEIYFAGALRPLFVANENGRVEEITGTRNSIGGGKSEGKKVFEAKRFPTTKRQRLYLTSDGYYSQFGGVEGKKFMKSQFKKTLEELQVLPLQEQKKMLEQKLAEWQGTNFRVDDVMVVGLEL